MDKHRDELAVTEGVSSDASITIFGISPHELRKYLRSLIYTKTDNVFVEVALNGHTIHDPEFKEYLPKAEILRLGQPKPPDNLRRVSVYTHRIVDGRGISKLMVFMRQKEKKPLLAFSIEKVGNDARPQFYAILWWMALAMLGQKPRIQTIPDELLLSAIPGWGDEPFIDLELGWLWIDTDLCHKWFCDAMQLSWKRLDDPQLHWRPTTSKSPDIAVDDTKDRWLQLNTRAPHTPISRLEQWFLRGMDDPKSLESGQNNLVIPSNIWTYEDNIPRLAPSLLPQEPEKRGRLLELLAPSR